MNHGFLLFLMQSLNFLVMWKAECWAGWYVNLFTPTIYKSKIKCIPRAPAKIMFIQRVNVFFNISNHCRYSRWRILRVNNIYFTNKIPLKYYFPSEEKRYFFKKYTCIFNWINYKQIRLQYFNHMTKLLTPKESSLSPISKAFV